MKQSKQLPPSLPTTSPRSAAAADKKVRAADRIAATIRALCLRVIFGLPGGAIAPLNDALMDVPEVRMVHMAHENNAVFAAAGYARKTGRPGIVAVTSGPGALNAITGLESAHRDHIPVVLLAGEVSRHLRGKNSLQGGARCNLKQILSSVTKWTDEVPTPDAAVPMLERAIQIAMCEPCGPTALILPQDVLVGPASATDVILATVASMQLPPGKIAEVANTVHHSRTVLIFAGSGVRHGSGPQKLKRLAEQLQCRVMTTAKGKDVFPENHPLSLGVFGDGGHPSALEYLETHSVDTLLVVGTCLSDIATNGGSPVLRQCNTLIHVDADVAQIGRNYAADIAVGAPAATFIDALLDHLPDAQPIRDDHPTEIMVIDGVGVTIASTDSDRDSPQPRFRRYTDPTELRHGPNGQIAPQRAIWEIQQLVPKDSIFVVDIGEHLRFATHYLKTNRPDSFMASTGLSAMGSSVGAVGVKLGDPDRTVVAILGDGCFSILAPELATVVREGLKVVFFVINDRRFGMVERGNLAVYQRTPSYSTEPLDISALARAAGAEAAIIRHADEILALDLETLLNNGPLVIDVQIDREVEMPKNPRFSALASVANDNRPDDKQAHRAESMGIVGIGTYLPPEIWGNDQWPESVVARWRNIQRSKAEWLRKQLASPERQLSEGQKRVLSAWEQYADDPFQGSQERRRLADGKLPSTMEVRAASQAIKAAGISPGEIDCVIQDSVVSDFLAVPNACTIHHQLKLRKACLTTSTAGACNAFAVQMELATRLFESGAYRYLLLVQSSAVPRIIRPDASHAPLFGYGATAVVVGPVAKDHGVLASEHRTDGSLADAMVASVPGANFYDDGRVVWYSKNRESVRKMLLGVADQAQEVTSAALAKAGLCAEDVDFFAGHQGTAWLRAVTQEHSGLTHARTLDTFPWAGSLGGANIPLVLATADAQGLLSDGDLIISYSGGSGITYASIALRWGR